MAARFAGAPAGLGGSRVTGGAATAGGVTGGGVSGGGVSESVDTRLSIRGMHCASCVTAVERALVTVADVAEASVSLVDGQATVMHGNALPDPQALVEAVEGAGYGAEVLAGPGAALEAELARDRERDEEQSRAYQALPHRCRVRSSRGPDRALGDDSGAPRAGRGHAARGLVAVGAC